MGNQYYQTILNRTDIYPHSHWVSERPRSVQTDQLAGQRQRPKDGGVWVGGVGWGGGGGRRAQKITNQDFHRNAQERK